jgi:L-cystine uptake protein TcyP (sodium:dicarboxylate symporter family)
MPEGELRNRVPTVEGAYTRSKSVFIPPARTTSRSSILSAPTHIPAITVVSFGYGLADPDAILGAAILILSANNYGRPVLVASVITGTNPAHDTRRSSSNTADEATKLWDTCTGSA